MSLDDEILNKIVDQIWEQYDQDKCGKLNEQEATDFLSVILQFNENIRAQSVGREIEEVHFSGTGKSESMDKKQVIEFIKDYMGKDKKIQEETKIMI